MTRPRYNAAAAAVILAIAGGAFAVDAEVCDSEGHHSKGNRFAFYPNSWAPEEDGFTCMRVTDDPPAFDTTWHWPLSLDTVNAFPHVKFQNTRVPTVIGEVTAVKLRASWGIGDGDEAFPVDGIRVDDMGKLGLRCNVGWDMFAARDKDKAMKETDADVEIMIWLGSFGEPWPLGFVRPSEYPTQTVGDIEFNLYTGTNQRKQKVHTWIGDSNYTSFDMDVYPLIRFLIDEKLVDGEEVLGLLEFGSETFFSRENVTFSAFNLGAEVSTNDKNAPKPNSAVGVRPGFFLGLLSTAAMAAF